MINKVALVRLEDICSSGIAYDSKLLFCKKPQALQEAAVQKESIRSLCRSIKPLKSIRRLCRSMKQLDDLL